MASANFWDRWLLFVGWLLVVFGLLLAFFNQSQVFDLAFNRQINAVFWPNSEQGRNVELFQTWIYGVLGATVSSWGVFVVFLARAPLRQREKWARNCILAGITLWYVTDTAISLFFGVAFNAAFNTVLAALVYVPLIATRGEFRNAS